MFTMLVTPVFFLIRTEEIAVKVETVAEVIVTVLLCLQITKYGFLHY